MDVPAFGHEPVLVNEILQQLALRPGASVVDCTLGRGGHALAMGQQLGPDGLLIGMDADPRNLAFAADRLAALPCRRRLFHANFAEVDDVLAEVGVQQVDALLADLGISTNQLFDPQYGLSFAAASPLDMRLDPRIGRSAADLVNQLDEKQLADLLFQYADERYSRRIARNIAQARRVSPITTTDRLAELVRAAVPQERRQHDPAKRIDPATRTFMALRMAVNDEPGRLSALLERAPRLLRPGGRVAIISFHSVEDRLVKQAFRSAEQTGLVQVLTKRPITPADLELAANPRSRSAKLRVAEKIARG